MNEQKDFEVAEAALGAVKRWSVKHHEDTAEVCYGWCPSCNLETAIGALARIQQQAQDRDAEITRLREMVAEAVKTLSYAEGIGGMNSSTCFALYAKLTAEAKPEAPAPGPDAERLALKTKVERDAARKELAEAVEILKRLRRDDVELIVWTNNHPSATRNMHDSIDAFVARFDAQGEKFGRQG